MKSSAKTTWPRLLNLPARRILHAELYYNDFDLENRPKCEGVIRLVKGLQAKGVRVDGIGIQGHWFMEHPPMEEIENHFVALGQLGSKLMITELDIGVLPYYPLESKIVDLSSFDAETQKKYNPYPNGLPEAAQKNWPSDMPICFPSSGSTGTSSVASRFGPCMTANPGATTGPSPAGRISHAV